MAVVIVMVVLIITAMLIIIDVEDLRNGRCPMRESGAGCKATDLLDSR